MYTIHLTEHQKFLLASACRIAGACATVHPLVTQDHSALMNVQEFAYLEQMINETEGE